MSAKYLIGSQIFDGIEIVWHDWYVKIQLQIKIMYFSQFFHKIHREMQILRSTSVFVMCINQHSTYTWFCFAVVLVSCVNVCLSCYIFFFVRANTRHPQGYIENGFFRDEFWMICIQCKSGFPLFFFWFLFIRDAVLRFSASTHGFTIRKHERLKWLSKKNFSFQLAIYVHVYNMFNSPVQHHPNQPNWTFFFFNFKWGFRSKIYVSKLLNNHSFLELDPMCIRMVYRIFY